MPHLTNDQFLSRLLLRAHLTDTEISAVQRLTFELSYTAARGTLVNRGDRTGLCCVVVSGLIARTETTIDGNRQISAFYVAGDMPDLSSLMLPAAPATLQAVANSHILRIPHKTLESLFVSYPGIAKALWREMLRETSIATEWLVNFGGRAGKQRMAHLFCEMACRSVGEPIACFNYAFPVTQAELGEATGLSAVHVNRIVQELRSDKLIEMRNCRIYVMDWARLKEEAGFDPTYLQVADFKTHNAAN